MCFKLERGNVGRSRLSEESNRMGVKKRSFRSDYNRNITVVLFWLPCPIDHFCICGGFPIECTTSGGMQVLNWGSKTGADGIFT